MTKQEFFDRGVAAIIKQGRPSIDKNGTGTLCRYRDCNGNACFLGQFIPDEDYSEKLEHLGASDAALLIAMNITEPGWSDFLDDCQSTHDDAAFLDGRAQPEEGFVDRFKINCRKVAAHWALNTKVLDQ